MRSAAEGSGDNKGLSEKLDDAEKEQIGEAIKDGQPWYYMYFNAHNFNSDINGWSVASCTNMHMMFAGASNFNAD